MVRYQRKPAKVEPGQVWKDLDIRTKGTGEMTVEWVGEWTDRRGRETTVARLRKEDGRRTRVRVDRLMGPENARGYAYIGRGK